MDAGELFKGYVEKDVQFFLDQYKENPGSVLVFPPVDNFKRFLIHNSVENHNDLCSFSVGAGDHRRTVISNKRNLISGETTTTRTTISSFSSPESPQKDTAFIPRERSKDKRRPDRPVYVPKGRTTTTLSPATPSLPTEAMPKSSKNSNAPKEPKKEAEKKKVEDDSGDDDWDSMFADDGECLNPEVMKELTAAVKNVQIVAAPTVTAAVQEEYNDEFAHVVEVSHFPVEFQTQDLMMLFQPYKQRGFEIKWVDDTHALVIFSSAKIAAEVVANKYPGVRLKRLSEASEESKGRARRSGAAMQPYKARPETCASLARRLVTGALGVRPRATKEQLENERKILREAKEKKKLAKQEQKDIWDDDEEEAADQTTTTSTTTKSSS